ncbi:MAG: hypothetical protein IH830_02890 [Planctomycetes bacterium]|nr:hypothetical protein [Planctomycetota bacterium]
MHGEEKTQHVLGRAARRGRWNVAIQSYLTAAVVNLKRLAKAAGYLWAWIRHAVDWMVERFVHKARIELLVQLRSTGLVHRHLRIA